MVVSRFENSLDGWTVDNGTEVFEAVGGNPDGSVRASEGGSGDYRFVAPAKFLGDMSSHYGGRLSFDLKQDGDANQFDSGDLFLTGDGLTLVADLGPNPGTDWTSYGIDLALGGGFKINSVSGRVATADEIVSALANLDSLQIRGEFVNGSTDDASNLDNVVMTEGASPPVIVPGPVVKSGFGVDVDGWSFVADVKEFLWQSSGGNPGGYLEAVDYATGQVWYFVAPDKYLGDKAAFLGGSLSFELKQSSTTSQFSEEDIVLEGGGARIVLDLADNPGLDWTKYTVRLNATADWRVDTLGGAEATRAEIKAVLADLTAIHIRGEYVNGADTGGLDNVKMKAPDGAFFNTLNRYDSEATLNVLSTHTTLQEGLGATKKGNALGTLDAGNTTQASYDVDTNKLTLISDAQLGTTFVLDGVRTLSLSGSNDMNITGNGLNNTLRGSDGDNTLVGDAGRDALSGRGGDDTLSGGADNDKLGGGGGADRLLGGKGSDVMHGGLGNDYLRGDKGNDVLSGGGGQDTLDGSVGNDVLLGGARTDKLTGGEGDDFLDGGDGKDVLIFKGNFGRDTVQFEDGFDVLKMVKGNGEVRSLSAFKDAAVEVGDMVVYDLGGDDKKVIVLLDTAMSDLTAADFNFA